jgi:hypothetical protein
MRAHIVRRASALCLLLLCTAGRGHAQELANSIEQLRVLVRPGDNVRVTDTSGREIKGKIDRLSSSSISLLVGGHARTLDEGEIATIRQRKDDRLSDGARNGFIGGAAFGLLVGLTVLDHGGGAFVTTAALVYGGLGASMGVGLDALVTHEQIVYDARERSPSAKVRVAPFMTPERKGVALSLRF